MLLSTAHYREIRDYGKMQFAVRLLINDLLQLAKTQSDKMKLHIERASMQQVIETLVLSLALLAKEKKIKIKSHVDADIPLLNTDIGKVQQILHNLFSNAVKFTDRRGRIEVHAGMIKENTVRISVKDNGCGISPEDQEKIFQKFRQLDGSITRQSSGTGLGLAISRELAAMVAGDIGLESETDAGSTFWLDLPVTLGLDGGQD
jgi:signal transduction histidine kinase